MSVLACATLIACGSTDDENPDATRTFEDACEGGTLNFTKGFKPEPGVDFIGFRTEKTTPRQIGDDPNEVEAVWSASFSGDTHGTLCATASDKADCERRVAETNLIGTTCNGAAVVPQDRAVGAPEAPTPGTCARSYVLYTRGDEIGTVEGYAQARELFGTIDSPEEALYLVQLRGGAVSCGGQSPAGTIATDDGYEVRAGSRCGDGTYRVSTTGEVSYRTPSGEEGSCL